MDVPVLYLLQKDGHIFANIDHIYIIELDSFGINQRKNAMIEVFIFDKTKIYCVISMCLSLFIKAVTGSYRTVHSPKTILWQRML
jgi:uncharacterized protein (DUF608 family)